MLYSRFKGKIAISYSLQSIKNRYKYNFIEFIEETENEPICRVRGMIKNDFLFSY